MAEDEDGEIPVHHEVSSGRGARVTGRDLHEHHVEISAPRARGILVGDNGAQVNIFVSQDPAEASAPPVAGAAGRLLGDVTDPFALEVHRPMQADGPSAGVGLLPTYVPRAHDRDLRKVVRAAAGGKSGIAVLVGGSSTGKTRACWEALELLREQEEPWRLWHPIDPSRPEAALRELPSVRPRTVVWLNEAQFYLGQDIGGQVAAGLRELLRDPGRAPVLVLATMWREYWHDLAVRPAASAPDPHSQARDLLAGRDIAVPPELTAAEIEEAADTGDPRLALAVTMAKERRVIQFLAGAPELVSRYEHALPAERALLDAAVDARRLGMGATLPRAFLQEAAPGYIAAADWDELAKKGNWPEDALTSTGTPTRGVRGPLAPDPLRPGDACQLADYLEQHGRRTRLACLPPGKFWLAAARHASPSDLPVLATAAENRGLLKDAFRLRKNATRHGSTTAAADLVRQCHDLHLDDPRPAQWTARCASLDDPKAVVRLLDALREAGAEQQVAALVARDPAGHASLDNPDGIADLLYGLWRAGAERQLAALIARDPAGHAPLDNLDAIDSLLYALRRMGAEQQVGMLAARAAGQAPLGDAGAVAALLTALHLVGAERQVAALVARDPAGHVALGDPRHVSNLLDALRLVGAEQQARILATRAAGQAPLGDLFGVACLLEALRAAGAEREVAALIARDPAGHAPLGTSNVYLLGALRRAGAEQQVAMLAARASLSDPFAVAGLLGALREAGAKQQVAALIARDPAGHVAPGDPQGVAQLLHALWAVCAEGQVAALIARDPAGHASLGDPGAVTKLLHALRFVGAERQVAALIAREPARHVALGDPQAVTELLYALRDAGAERQVGALIARMPAEGQFSLFLERSGNREQYRFGREPDGSKAPRWGWDDLDD